MQSERKRVRTQERSQCETQSIRSCGQYLSSSSRRSVLSPLKVALETAEGRRKGEIPKMPQSARAFWVLSRAHTVN